MSFRRTLATGSVLAVLVGCTSQERHAPPPVSRSPANIRQYRFLPDSRDSQKSIAVNCQAQPSSGAMEAFQGNTPNTLTVGASDQRPSKLDNAPSHFLGGITIYKTGISEIKIVSSNAKKHENTQLDPTHPDYATTIGLDRRHSIGLLVINTPQALGGLSVRIDCKAPHLHKTPKTLNSNNSPILFE